MPIDLQLDARRGLPFVLSPDAGGTGNTEGMGYGVVIPCRSREATGLADGDLVKITGDGGNTPGVVRTTSVNDAVFGVVLDPTGAGVPLGDMALILVEGWHPSVSLTGSTSPYQYLRASDTSGAAQATSDARTPGIMGQLLGAASGARILTQPLFVGVHRQLGQISSLVRHADLNRSAHTRSSNGGYADYSADENDATYCSLDNLGNWIRVDCGFAVETGGALLRVAHEYAIAAEFEVSGTNASDYSGLTLLGTASFTPTGGMAQDLVEMFWATSPAYRYYQLERTGGSNICRMNGWELWEAAGHTLVAKDPTSTSSARIDDIFASVFAGGLPLVALEFIIDAGGVAIQPGIKGDLEMPFDGVIEEVRLLADQVGALVLDLWLDDYAAFPPTVADTITASAKPTLSAAQKYEDTTLTGWTTTFAAGDILRFNVDSASTVERVTASLRVRRT